MTQTDVSPQELPRLVAFDLDDTLAPSKSAMPPAMATALRRLLDVVPVCIISGGQVGQFRDQVLARLDADADELSRLHLMPTCGTRYYTYDSSQPAQGGDAWKLVYANDLTPEQIRTGFEIVEAQARRLWGEILEDRGSQITFSALGQDAPLEAKRAWDPTGEKKAALRDAVAPLLPDRHTSLSQHAISRAKTFQPQIVGKRIGEYLETPIRDPANYPKSERIFGWEFRFKN